MSKDIKPFTIAVDQKVLDDLQERVAKTVWPNVIKGEDANYGPALADIQNIAHKLQKFDWRKAEAKLNELPHFTTEIDGQNIHFIHVESKHENAIPLMLIHGWPGSFVEFVDVVEPLTNPAKGQQAFHVIVPSLPGFGFSGPTEEAGWNNDRIGKAFLELMSRLGYEKFGVQGGDAGAIIGPDMARTAPERMLGVHVNAATMGFIPMGPVDDADLATFTPAEKERFERIQNFMQEKFGFNLLQSHQPQLVAYAISDSPVGMMAWMSQLFDPRTLPEQFLTNFVVYWATGTIASSIRIYFENAHDPSAWAPKANSGVPTGVAVFQEGDIAIRKFSEPTNTIVRWNEYHEGGHYAVMEVPEVWTKDVREFFAELSA